MKLADPDVVLAQRGDRGARFFEFHREMAGVIIDAQILVQPGIVFVLGAKAVEEMNHFTAAFEKTKRLGFKAKMECAACLRAKPRDVFDATPQIAANFSGRRRFADEFFESPGKRADAAIDSGRKELCERVEKQIGVGQPLGGRPILKINIFLYARAMKAAERKAVYGENVTLVLA